MLLSDRKFFVFRHSFLLFFLVAAGPLQKFVDVVFVTGALA